MMSRKPTVAPHPNPVPVGHDGFDRALSAWSDAVAFDPTIDPVGQARSTLRRTWVEPVAYSRRNLFDAMARSEPRLYADFPIDARTRSADAVASVLLPALQRGFAPEKRARVRSAGRLRYQTMSTVIGRWAAQKSCFAVTDLHYIGARFDRLIDTQALNAFNLLPRGAQGFQSQDSLVICSRGAVTDSHADDHSGSNHCFVGRKLWLLWDTLEGLAQGLQDASHVVVTDRAAFDVSAFLRLRSARWLVIGPGQTMFIPAHLSHKVITLERYLGLGSFHASLPGLPDLLLRWQALQPYWSRGAALDPRCTVEHLVQRALRRLRHLREADQAERARWGTPELLSRLERGVDPRGAARGYAHEVSPHLPALRRAAQALAWAG